MIDLPRSRKRGLALVLTLAVLVIITLIVVTYASVVRMEIISARSSFDEQRARILASSAISEGLAKLKDAIPPDRLWAAGPGRIQTYGANGNWTLTELHSGTAGGSPTGSVALNAPSTVDVSINPILSPNAEFPTPNPMEVAWINVLQDGTRSTSASYAPTAANPIVGRYAYWMDAETSKVNLNTAGKAQTTYVTSSYDTPPNDEDIQNLSGHPSRVDLTQLDGIDSPKSLATYNFAASGLWFGGDGKDNLLGGLQSNPSYRANGQGMQTFGSLEEWTRIPGLTPGLVEKNKFYLTTQARTPELTPWSYNKMWWQSSGGPQMVPRSGSGYASWAENLRGNRINVLNALPFPITLPAANNGSLLTWPGPANSNDFADSRYFVYPPVVSTYSPTVSSNANNLQHMGWLTGITNTSTLLNKEAAFQLWMENMMALLERNDWPGMPARSFIDKYGREECESLALNMLCLYDSAAANAGFSPYNSPYNTTDLYFTPDAYGMYGSRLAKYTRPDGTVRRLAGIGPWPYINEVAVTLTPTRSNNSTGPIDPNTGKPAGRPKGTWGPGTPPEIPASNTSHVNLLIQPKFELIYPSSLSHTNKWVVYRSSGPTGEIALVSIEVLASGKYNGSDVTYGGNPTSDLNWGYPDDPTRSGFGGNYPSPLAGSPRYIEPSNTPFSGLGRGIYIGPFDKNAPVTVDVKFRVAATRQPFAGGGHSYATQVIPSVEDFINDLDDPANPTKLTYHFAGFLPDGLTPSPTKSLELCDPRVYRYRSDWRECTAFLGHTLGAHNSVYVSEYFDTLTGIKGDSSKLTWPNVGAAARTTNYINPVAPETHNYNPRSYQSASNITGFPGIGWLSVLPTNIESGGTWTNGTRTPKPGPPTPWRTLSLEPSTTNELPDWLLLDLFTIAYERTYLSQTQGKININADIAPFGFNRLSPLRALLIPSAANSSTAAATIAANIASHNTTNVTGSNLPSNTYVYAGQICQVAGMAGSGSGTQFEREALARDTVGLVTTKSSDFKIHVVAQSLAPNQANPAEPGKMTAEQRTEAIISRVVDVGPDGIPATADDMAGPDQVTGTSDDLTFKSSQGQSITKLKYDGSDPIPEGLSGRPPFRYEITQFRFLNP